MQPFEPTNTNIQSAAGIAARSTERNIRSQSAKPMEMQQKNTSTVRNEVNPWSYRWIIEKDTGSNRIKRCKPNSCLR